jgi:hypothetical protein
MLTPIKDVENPVRKKVFAPLLHIRTSRQPDLDAQATAVVAAPPRVGFSDAPSSDQSSTENYIISADVIRTQYQTSHQLSSSVAHDL